MVPSLKDARDVDHVMLCDVGCLIPIVVGSSSLGTSFRRPTWLNVVGWAALPTLQRSGTYQPHV